MGPPSPPDTLGDANASAHHDGDKESGVLGKHKKKPLPTSTVFHPRVSLFLLLNPDISLAAASLFAQPSPGGDPSGRRAEEGEKK